MTRYEKWKGTFLIATIRDNPDERYRALRKMQQVCSFNEWHECLDFEERFEAADDLTPDEARKLLKAMKGMM